MNLIELTNCRHNPCFDYSSQQMNGCTWLWNKIAINEFLSCKVSWGGGGVLTVTLVRFVISSPVKSLSWSFLTNPSVLISLKSRALSRRGFSFFFLWEESTQAFVTSLLSSVAFELTVSESILINLKPLQSLSRLFLIRDLVRMKGISKMVLGAVRSLLEYKKSISNVFSFSSGSNLAS